MMLGLNENPLFLS